MLCPTCKEVTLVMAERHGIEVDYCPRCRGVWLDRGELDKIIERAAADAPSREPLRPREPEPLREPEHHRRGERDEYEYRRKKRGFLGDLFDFD
jgi:uncharacterized protein